MSDAPRSSSPKTASGLMVLGRTSTSRRATGSTHCGCQFRICTRGRRALLGLDSVAPGRADALLADRQEVLDRETQERARALRASRREARLSLQALRKFFSSPTYKDSFIARVRNGIGFHYGSSDTEFAKLIADNMTEDDLMESTAAGVGGRARRRGR